MTAILWPLVPADLARTAPGGTSYVLRVTANGVTENLTTPTMTAGRLYWLAGDAQADADGGLGGVGDLIAILQATLETHSELTALNTAVNIDLATNVITIAVTGFAWTILWSHASTTLSALPWGWTQVDVSGSDVGGGLYRAIAPNQTYGAFLPGRPVSFDSREKSAFKVRAAKSISDLQRTSRVAVGKPTRDLRFDLLAQAYALREYSPATRPTGTAEDIYLFAASVGRPVRYYPSASSRTSTSYSGPYVFRAEEGLDSRESLIEYFGEPRIRRWTFRLPLRSWSSSASGVSFAGVSSPAGGGGAPVAAQYVTLATHADLTAERVLTATSPITLADGGANGNVTLALSAPAMASLVYGWTAGLEAESVATQGSTNLISNIGPSVNTTGTAASGSIASTNVLTRRLRVRKTSATADSSVGGWLANTLTVFRADGFWFEWIFGFNTFATTNRKFLAGLQSSATSAAGYLASTNPSAELDMVGAGSDSGDAGAIYVMHNDGAGAATRVATGLTVSTSELYWLELRAAPAGNIAWRLRALGAGTLVSGTLSSNLPTTTVAMGPVLQAGNGASAGGAAVAIDAVGWRGSTVSQIIGGATL